MIMKILIADDHAVLRSGLKMMLNSQEDMKVVAEASSDSETVMLSEKHQPDIILLDITMPKHGGIKTIPEIKKKSPSSRILVLTMHDDDSYLKDVLKAGGNGYIIKKAADTDLLSAIRAVFRGESYIDPSMTKHLIFDMFGSGDQEKDEGSQLSQRETEVLKYMALGYTNKQISETLYVSVKTVETYKVRIKKKLNVSRRSELIKYAINTGLIDFQS